MQTQYSINEIVWVKCLDSPWWPAKIIAIQITRQNIEYYTVSFYAWDGSAVAQQEHLRPFEDFLRDPQLIRNPIIPLLGEVMRKLGTSASKNLTPTPVASQAKKPVFPVLRRSHFSRCDIRLEKLQEVELTQFSNFKPVLIPNIHNGFVCMENSELACGLDAAELKKLRVYRGKMYSLIKKTQCEKRQARAFCCSFMRKVSKIWHLKQKQLKLLYSQAKRYFEQSFSPVLLFEMVLFTTNLLDKLTVRGNPRFPFETDSTSQ